MKVRQHIFINEVCRVCGADSFPKVQRIYSARGLAVPQEDNRTCLERDDHYGKAEMRPEPKRREYAFDDADIIGQRMKELEAERLAATNHVESTPQTAAPEEVDWMCGMYGQFPNKPLMYVVGDLFKSADFPNADIMVERLIKLSEKSIG